ncbi:uncharacterized protein E0L32_011324 [Thyridium curvatum]|uniref:Uncharacterized protein n=1 Tax=Thyridium curvatum TaxID=1093900 RepID=A0A507BGC4_9PEZI|nr:uncharacterized protein E0L32_011324 [Thyridium curvatum]TPX19007.1 hypothetical protein E0L32_011324 [Thyridium curvatum]
MLMWPLKSQPLTTATANPNAATAALSAFKRQESPSTTSLSSAAAAAALRARPATPTNVSEVQTKRTLRRSASASSRGTLDQQNARRLERRASSSSMTERTFRSPSPHRPSSSGSNGHRYSQSAGPEDLPPVPSIPKSVTEGQHHRKANSLGFTSQPLKLASEKLGKDTQGTWFGKAAVGDASNVRTSDAIMSSAVSTPQKEPRPSSRSSSVNFSYPARTRVASPPPGEDIYEHEPEVSEPTTRRRSVAISPDGVRAPKHRHSQEPTMVYDPNSRRMVPQISTLMKEQEIQDAADKPRPRKKKQAASKAGSHLAHGSVARTTGTAVHDDVGPPKPPRAQTSTPPPQTYEAEYDEPAVKAIIGSPKQQRREEPQERRSDVPATDFLPLVDDQSDNHPIEGKSEPEPDLFVATGHAAPEVAPVEEARPEPKQQVPAADDATKSTTAAVARTEREHQEIPSHQVIPPTPPAELPAEVSHQLERVAPAEPKAVAFEPREAHAVRQERTHSNSPARAAHFGPVVHDSLTVRHSPPSRSISPRKSALKQHSPSRGASPSDDTSEASAPASTVVSPHREEPGSHRKKSVRVSFDDQNTGVVGQAAPTDRSSSPILPSPQSARRPWYGSLGIGKKKDHMSLDDDEIMKPRPALPSFGSVREKKLKEHTEERPLVRPHEPSHSPPRSSSPPVLSSITGTAGEETQEPIGQSSDQAIGSLLAQEQSRNPANISRFREPLPPVVTSIEGSGYVSDSSSSTSESSDADLVASTPGLRQEESTATTIPETEPLSKPLDIPADIVETTAADDEPSRSDPAETHPAAKEFVAPADSIPTIAISHPSQEKLPQTKSNLLGVPGTFPEDDSDSSFHEVDEKAGSSLPAPARQAALEPVAQDADAHSSPQTPATVLATRIPVIEEESDESGSSIYSDAYEDLSDMEGDGFLSLDAVVESPVATSVAKSPFASATNTPSQPKVEAIQPVQKQVAIANATPEPVKTEDDWENAKSYWRSLTAEKRAQLEKEAMDEAAVDADLEENKAPKKPRRKKSVEKKTAERRAIEKIHADPERTYMIKPGTKVGADGVTPTMRSTMRGEQKSRQQPAGAQDDGATRMRKSLRTNGPKAASAPVKAPRPKSLPVQSAAASTATRHARNMSDASSTATAPGRPNGFSTLRRRGSDSSESSFKRSRPRTSEGFGFRRTMRTAEPSSPASVEGGRDRSSRFSLRSLSPSGSAFRQSPSGGMGMRSTLRDSGAKQSKGGFFSRSSGSKSQSRSKGKSSSRFDDSSDEDVRRPMTFSSRFDDSSDDEVVPAKLPPLSIPKTMRSSRGPTLADKSPPLPEEIEESSPELPDSDEDAQRGAAGAGMLPQPGAGGANLGTGTIRRSRSGRGELSMSPTSPTAAAPKHQRRSSFMSVLRRKKGEGSKIQRAEVTESAARRDTKLERSQQELAAMRSNSLKKQQQGGPRLQKRSATSDGWPLRDGDEDEGEDDGEEEEQVQVRPATSSGVPAAAEGGPGRRPSFLQRRTMSGMSQGVVSTDGVGGEQRKKKKFGALRRMFRLDD